MTKPHGPECRTASDHPIRPQSDRRAEMQPTQMTHEQNDQDREREAGIREFVARHSHHRGLEVTLHLGDLRVLLSLLDVEREKVARYEEPYRVQPPASSLRPMSSVTGPAMSPEEMRTRAALSRNSTPAEIAARLRAERRERAERAAARHALTDQPKRDVK